MNDWLTTQWVDGCRADERVLEASAISARVGRRVRITKIVAAGGS